MLWLFVQVLEATEISNLTKFQTWFHKCIAVACASSHITRHMACNKTRRLWEVCDSTSIPDWCLLLTCVSPSVYNTFPGHLLWFRSPDDQVVHGYGVFYASGSTKFFWWCLGLGMSCVLKPFYQQAMPFIVRYSFVYLCMFWLILRHCEKMTLYVQSGAGSFWCLVCACTYPIHRILLHFGGDWRAWSLGFEKWFIVRINFIYSLFR
jgi:hypothetical protein